MENNIFDKAGNDLPYVMPEGFDATELMQKAISQESKGSNLMQKAISQESKGNKIVRLAPWIGSVAAAAAAVLLFVFISPSVAQNDPSADYEKALMQYCNSVSDTEMEQRIDMVEADYVANIDHYEAYYTN